MSTKPTLGQLRSFVGNPDAYAVQLPDGSWRPRREKLTPNVLRRHLVGEHTVGTYLGFKEEFGPPINSTLTVTNTLCLDVDTGFEADSTSLVQALLGHGVPPHSVGVEFSGRKGYHVWVMFPKPVLNSDARRLGRGALALANLDVEVYPKQDDVTDLGNLVKLPGGVHRVTGKHNDFTTPVPTPMTDDEWRKVKELLPPEVAARSSSHTEEVRFPCLATIQDEGVQEGSRNISLVHLGVMLRRAGVQSEFIEYIVRAVNERGDPVDDFELQQILESSTRTGPLCDQLPEDRRCGDLCIKARLKGLKDFPGQLRGAAVGEKVVVTVAERKGDELTLEHSDVSKMRGVLKDAH